MPFIKELNSPLKKIFSEDKSKLVTNFEEFAKIE